MGGENEGSGRGWMIGGACIALGCALGCSSRLHPLADGDVFGWIPRISVRLHQCGAVRWFDFFLFVFFFKLGWGLGPLVVVGLVGSGKVCGLSVGGSLRLGWLTSRRLLASGLSWSQNFDWMDARAFI